MFKNKKKTDDSDPFLFCSIMKKRGYFLMYEKSLNQYAYKCRSDDEAITPLIIKEPSFFIQLQSEGIEIIPYGKKYYKLRYIFL